MKSLAIWAISLASVAACSNVPVRPDLVAVHPDLRWFYTDEVFGPHCSLPAFCGDLVKISCAPEVDGPEGYFDNVSGNLVMACGGSCMVVDPNDPQQCKSCPPKEWACPDP